MPSAHERDRRRSRVFSGLASAIRNGTSENSRSCRSRRSAPPAPPPAPPASPAPAPGPYSRYCRSRRRARRWSTSRYGAADNDADRKGDAEGDQNVESVVANTNSTRSPAPPAVSAPGCGKTGRQRHIDDEEIHPGERRVRDLLQLAAGKADEDQPEIRQREIEDVDHSGVQRAQGCRCHRCAAIP